MDTSIAAHWHKEFNCGWIGAGPKSATTNKEVRDTSVDIRNDQQNIRACRGNLGCVPERTKIGSSNTSLRFEMPQCGCFRLSLIDVFVQLYVLLLEDAL